MPEVLYFVNAPLFLGFLGWPMLAWFSGTAACTVPGLPTASTSRSAGRHSASA